MFPVLETQSCGFFQLEDGHLSWSGTFSGYLGKNCPNIQDEPGSDVHPTLEIITLGAVNHLVNGMALP
jgi:hypothetical protein